MLQIVAAATKQNSIMNGVPILSALSLRSFSEVRLQLEGESVLAVVVVDEVVVESELLGGTNDEGETSVF